MKMPVSETYQIDCVTAMKEMGDNVFDLAIVDPPFGLNMEQGNSDWIRKKFTKKGKKWDSHRPNVEYFNELYRVSKNQIIWGGNYFVEFLRPSMGWITWFKTYECVGRCFSEFELAFTSFSRAARVVELKPFQKNNSRIHPTQKPTALYKWILQNYAKEGDRILDTHLGSQSSRIAAYDLGFDFVGYETDYDYFTAGNERFERHAAQPKLFEPVKVELKQESLLF